MTDYYKSLNLEKQRQLQQQQQAYVKEEFLCSEKIKQRKISKGQSGGGRPGISSSSEENVVDEEEPDDKTSEEHEYIENNKKAYGFPGQPMHKSLFKPLISTLFYFIF